MNHVAVGIGLREPHLDALLDLDPAALDVLEVMVDELLDPGPWRERVRRVGARWPLVAHGTELGIASASPPAPGYLARVGAAVSSLHAHWYSEHLSFLQAGGVSLGHFAPFFDDAEGIAALTRNAATVRAALPCPMLLENPADILGFGCQGPGSGRNLGRSFARGVRAAGCGALLDLTNLIYGARNDGYDARAYLDALDMDRVVEIHLAGGCRLDGLWIDSHDQDVDAEALALLPEVARRAKQLRAVVIERDDRLPPLTSLLEQVEEVRSRLVEAGRR